MGEAVANEAKLALLDVLLDGVEGLFLGDLPALESSSQFRVHETNGQFVVYASSTIESYAASSTHLLLGVGPARDLNDHVQDSLLLVGEQRNVVEGGDRLAILLDVGAELESVGLADLANGVLGGSLVRHVLGCFGVNDSSREVT